MKDGYRNADDANFTAKWMLIATWHKVKAYGMSDNKVRYAGPLKLLLDIMEQAFKFFGRIMIQTVSHYPSWLIQIEAKLL